MANSRQRMAYKKTVGWRLAIDAPQTKTNQTAVLKQRISRPPFSIDTAAKGGYAVSFYLVRSLDLSKKAQAPDKDILLYNAKYVGI